MLDAYHYCERLVRESDKDRFLATLFAPARHRPALFSVYAFDLEVGRVRERVSEPIAGEIRLQWWHDAISGNSPEQAAGNPVASALTQTTTAFRLPRTTILDVIEAQRLELYADASESETERKAVGILSLAVRILNDGSDPGVDDLIAHAAAAMVHREREHVRRHLDGARALLAAAPGAVLPAFLPLTLVRARLGSAGEISQWRIQWILWRASRNLIRWL